MRHAFWVIGFLSLMGRGEASAGFLMPGDIVTDVVNFGGVGGRGAVIRVDPSTGAQTVISSGGLLSVPAAIAFDAAGNIVLADALAGIIRIDGATGAQSLVSAGGNFIYPVGIAIDAGGGILVADRSAHEVIRVDPLTGAQRVVSAGGYLSAGIGEGPNGIAVDAAGRILVGISYSTLLGPGSVIRVDPVTGAQTVVSSGGLLNGPNDIALDSGGRILVVDGDPRSSVVQVDPATGAQRLVTSGLSSPLGIAAGPSGELFVTDGLLNAIVRVDSVTGSQAPVTSGGFFAGGFVDGIAVVPGTVPGPSTLATSGTAALIGLACRWRRRRRAVACGG